MVFHQRVDDGIESLLDDFLRLQLRETDFIGNRFDNLFFCHYEFPYEEDRPRKRGHLSYIGNKCLDLLQV